MALGMCVGLAQGIKPRKKIGADTSADKMAVEKLQIMPYHCHIDVDLLPYL